MTIHYNTIQGNAMHMNAIQYNTIQSNTIQYNTILSAIIKVKRRHYESILYKVRAAKNRSENINRVTIRKKRISDQRR